MNFRSRLALLLPLLARCAVADIIARSICTCASSSSAYTAYAFMFSYLPSSAYLLRPPSSDLNNTWIVSDYCGPSTRCSQDFTYLRAYRVEQNRREFVYHRELFGPDQYEFDGSGRRDVPVKQAREIEDVQAHCDRVCVKLDWTWTMKSQCGGKTCKAQVSWYRGAEVQGTDKRSGSTYRISWCEWGDWMSLLTYEGLRR